MQEDETPCPDDGTWEVTAAAGSSSSDGPSEIRAVLARAGECMADPDFGGNANFAAAVVAVRWEGSIQTSEPFLVPGGVELRVVGDGWYDDDTGGGDNDDTAVPEADEELEAAVSAADVGVGDQDPSVMSSSNRSSLFVVQPGGALRLSKISLSGAWGGADGGGAVRSLGGEVTAEDVRWRSLAAEGAGGAILAQDGANVSLSGLNLFQGCSSSTLGGGALYFGNATCSLGDGARVYFEGCSAAGDGGGIELRFSSRLAVGRNSTVRFRGCDAGDKGGGLFMKSTAVDVGAAASLEFQGCASGNISGAKGGGMVAYESSLSVARGGTLTFLNNSAPIGDAGGLYAQNTPVHVAGGGAALVFTGNRCEDSGGGMSLEFVSADDDSSIPFEDRSCLVLEEGTTVDFSGNAAVEYGGGAYVFGCEVSASGSALSFRDNAAERAGALYIDEAGVFLSGGEASFVGNSADRWATMNTRETFACFSCLHGVKVVRGCSTVSIPCFKSLVEVSQTESDLPPPPPSQHFVKREESIYAG